jgi:hypothetical protein
MGQFRKANVRNVKLFQDMSVNNETSTEESDETLGRAAERNSIL